MSDRFVITEYRGKLLSFLVEDGKAMEIRGYDDCSVVGNIYVAVVSNVLENIGAVFADIKKGVSVYIALEEFEKRPKRGELITVRIIKDAYMKKKAVATTVLSVTTDTVVVSTDSRVGVSSKISSEAERDRLKVIFKGALGGRNYGGIIRTSAEGRDEKELEGAFSEAVKSLEELVKSSGFATAYSCIFSEPSALVKDVRELKCKRDIIVVTDIRDVYDRISASGMQAEFYDDGNLSLMSCYNLNKLMERVLSERAYLKSGGFLVIETTEALNVIDVNSGKDIKGSDREESLLNINLEAAEEIARQLRLRNLTGIVIIDFISMKEPSHERLLLEHLEEELSKDFVKTVVVDITKLGLVELTRAKQRKPLSELLS